MENLDLSESPMLVKKYIYKIKNATREIESTSFSIVNNRTIRCWMAGIKRRHTDWRYPHRLILHSLSHSKKGTPSNVNKWIQAISQFACQFKVFEN